MRIKNFKIIAASILLGVFILNTYCLAGGIKERMKARRPEIKALKAAGIIGENNMGFVAFVGEKREKQDVVDAENNDRKKVYTAIGKQQGAPAGEVGKRRALKIAAKAPKGAWLQNDTGKWYQKK